MKKSPCCNAKIDYRGGGYNGKELCDLTDYCSKCGQLIAANGILVDKVYDYKNNKIIKLKPIPRGG